MDFEWNVDKAENNSRKHGIAFQEAITVFRDPLSPAYPDLDHSADEDRYLIIVLSSSGNVLVISHIFRNDSIRIISACKATKKERAYYETESTHW
ncbi:BrnT family toxin [Accumulibacter sp.]|uniref:BrnT family toxin n=1 Tax=Accumulibacter sp. TaxID=2053492 RepID=UPI001AD2C9ED|nr:BrnT family toxin [Accumulibacter sp.]MBN8454357.1 BrnT family toxin [Accumulibacter sp.]